MKKIFLLIPVLAFALMANAKEIEVSSGTSNIIHFIIAASSTSDGDVLVLKDAGPYVSTKADEDDYTKLSKNITIKAKTGISPVIQLQVPIQGRNGKSAKFIGIKFDCSELQYDNLVHFNDAQDNELEFEDCEFYNSNQYLVRISEGKKVESLKFKNCKFYNNSSTRGILNEGTIGHLELDGCEVSGFVKEFIHGYSGSSHVDECIINDCYFHNNSRSAVMFVASTVEGQQTCDQLTVTNSTFANINATGEYESVIEVRPYGSATTDAINVLVDHCTFYNNTTIDGSYTNIRTAKLSDVTISNCIFAHSEEYARRATYCTGGGNINNCLTYNYTAEGTKGHAYGAAVNAASVVADPQFTDAANGDFTFANNWVTMSLSPAIGAATDGTDLGDPRWHTMGTLPSTDFASDYDLLGTKAVLSGRIGLNGNDHIAYNHNSVTADGTAIWKLHVSRACNIRVVADREAGNSVGCQLTLTVKDADGNTVGEPLNAPGSYNDNDIQFPGTISFPGEGDYTLILTNSTLNSTAIIEKIILSYLGGAVQEIPTNTLVAADALFSDKGTRADGMITYTTYSGQWAKWNVVVAGTGVKAYKFTLNVNNPTSYGHNFSVSIYENEEEPAVATLSEHEWNSAYGEPVALPLEGVAMLEGGKNYVVKVTNAESGAQPKIISVVATYEGGAVQEIPTNSLPANEALISNKGSRADGMITYTTYSGQWAKWNVVVAGTGMKYYSFKLNINNPTSYGHNFSVSIYEDEEEPAVATLSEHEWNSAYGEPVALPLEGVAMLEGGKHYVVKVTNAESGAQPKIVSVDVEYIGGAVQEIPTNTLVAADALFSDKGTRADGMITYTTYSGQWAKWNVIVAGTGVKYYNFKLNINNPTSYGHNFSVNIYEDEEEPAIATLSEHEWNSAYGEPVALPLEGVAMLEGGKHYVVKVTNAESGAQPKIVSVEAIYAGGGQVTIPNADIPLSEAVLSSGATRDNDGIHFNGNVSQYAQWNISAIAGMYTFTLNVVGTNYGKYQLDITDDAVNIHPNYVGKNGSGEVVISNIYIPSDGDYVLQLANVNSGADGYISSVAAAIDESVLIVDEMATNMQYITDLNGQSRKPLLKRSFVANMYNTVVFPFNGVTDEELTSIFGAGYELLTMTSAVLDGNTLNLNFAPVDLSQNTYGTPYLIKPTQDVVNPMFSSKTIYASTSHLTVDGGNAEFIGSFIKGEVPAGEDNLFLGPDNTLYFSQNATPIKGMRAWFNVKGGAAGVAKRACIVLPNNVPTEIELVNSQEPAKSQKLLQDGQLIIIRDGVRYNVMGVMIK